ncbi:MAG TPA: serine hydrolase domain-containing protein [Candidatus Eremiobacteraceae bacterium]|nr:serine hydrolase domain-containing protein [Candidatus Eremiobacteraceae bacterium]
MMTGLSDAEMKMNRVRVAMLAAVAGAIVMVGGARVSAQKNAGGKGAGGGAERTATIDMNVVKPEAEGFSSERLENFHALMQGVVDRKELPGAVTILARHGKVIDYRVFGVKDLESGAKLEKDSIFRDFSMTKPVTAVAMMILYEQGKWLPMDPISKYIPEFKDLKVFKDVDAAGNMVVEEPKHAPTMGELMTHTAGFTYGFFGNTPVDKEYAKQKVMESKSLQEFIDRLAKIPLMYQPGTKWSYSASMDVQGYIIEKLSGQSLPDFYAEHIFKPLGMKDAGFFVPAEKRARFVTLYQGSEKEPLKAVKFGGDYETAPGMPSGGGGMVSTAEDYYRFASMLASGGELNGVRIISPESVTLMSSNHLAPHLLTGEFGIGSHTMRAGFGYGYNCAVVFDPPMAGLPDGKGEFFWDGAAGTWFWVDPTNDVVFVGMIQRMFGPGAPNVEYSSRSTIYGALVEPKK